MEWNDHKRIERNGMEWNIMYLSKGKEWKRMKLRCFKIKELWGMKMNEI